MDLKPNKRAVDYWQRLCATTEPVEMLWNVNWCDIVVHRHLYYIWLFIFFPFFGGVHGLLWVSWKLVQRRGHSSLAQTFPELCFWSSWCPQEWGLSLHLWRVTKGNNNRLYVLSLLDIPGFGLFFSKRRAEYWFLVTRYSGTGITWVSAVLKTVKSSTSGHLPAAYLYRRRKQWASSRWHRRTLTWPIGSRAWNREILGEL